MAWTSPALQEAVLKLPSFDFVDVASASSSLAEAVRPSRPSARPAPSPGQKPRFSAIPSLLEALPAPPYLVYLRPHGMGTLWITGKGPATYTKPISCLRKCGLWVASP